MVRVASARLDWPPISPIRPPRSASSRPPWLASGVWTAHYCRSAARPVAPRRRRRMTSGGPRSKPCSSVRCGRRGRCWPGSARAARWVWCCPVRPVPRCPGSASRTDCVPGWPAVVKDMADEYGPRGVRVFGLLPYRLLTDRNRELFAAAPGSGRGARRGGGGDPAGAARRGGGVRAGGRVPAVPRGELPDRAVGASGRWRAARRLSRYGRSEPSADQVERPSSTGTAPSTTRVSGISASMNGRGESVTANCVRYSSE